MPIDVDVGLITIKWVGLETLSGVFLCDFQSGLPVLLVPFPS